MCYTYIIKREERNAMQYTVRVWNKSKAVLSQTADMPTCMHLLGIVMQGDWTDADMISEQTGEVIMRWVNNSDYGITTG